MPYKVLFVSQYADPNLVGGTNNVYRQAHALKHALDIDVELLTWPEGDVWSGPLPVREKTKKYSHLDWDYGGLNYHIVQLHKKYLDRTLNDSDWQEAIEIGCELLKRINPDIVHLQHWRGLWWILESAKMLSIPTVYSAHDWGIGCLRTILVKGKGGLCDGIVDIDKCTRCVWDGRPLIGKANELLVSTEKGERIFNILARPAIEQYLFKRGAVRQGLRKRVTQNCHRANVAMSTLSALIVPNLFAKEFYMQFGIHESRIHVEPWYYDLTVSIKDSGRNDPDKLVIGYIGRISPEKGVHRVFEALLRDSIPVPIHLVVAGAIDSKYGEQLYAKFQHNVGKHSVQWMGWLPHRDIHKFYEMVDVVLISSECLENGPLTLIESYAFKCPVIISDMPSVRELVHEGRTGFFYTFGSTSSLEKAIGKVTLSPNDLLEMKKNIPEVKSSLAYAVVIKAIYESIVGNASRHETSG
jgi:glycosyltransferase involved in cell wall biosynthesis